MGHAAAVADDIESFVQSFEVFVQFHFHVIELYLHAVEQRVVVGRTRRDLVQRIDHLDDTVQDPLGQDQAQVARRRRQRGRDQPLLDALDRASAAADQIAEALHDHAAAEHI